MDFCRLSPYIRFINIFSYYPKGNEFVIGYDYRIFYILDGSMKLNFKESSYILERNSFVFIPPEMPYKLEPVENINCELLCFNFDCVKNDLTLSSIHPEAETVFDKARLFEKDRITEFERKMVIKDASWLFEKLMDIYKEFQSKQLGYREKGEAGLCCVLIACIRRAELQRNKETSLVMSVKEYLHENLSQPCEAETIGEIFHYHPNYINRVFKEKEGTTLHSYLIDQRIIAAKELLAASNLTLEKISLKCGFKTLAHFSLCFKKQCGISPSSYRKQCENIII